MKQTTKIRIRRLFAWLLAAPVVAWAADPQIAAFTDTPDPVIAGAAYSYIVRVDNNALDAAINTRLRVTVPSGSTFVSASPASQNCALISAGVVECNLGTLGGNSADAREITVTWRATVPGLTSVSATAEIFADNDVNPNNNIETESTTINAGANVALTMTGSPNPVAPGGALSYSLLASNAGPNTVANLTVTSNLPPTSTYTGFSGSGWSCSAAGSTVTCSRSGPYVAGTQAPPLTLETTVGAQAGVITHSASVSGGAADPDASDNTATVSTTVLTGADLRINSKTSLSGSSVASNTNVTFRITPRNAGPQVATSVVLTDTLPSGWSFVSANGNNWSCSAAGQTVSCTRASLPVGAADDIDITARSPATPVSGGSSYTNTATLTSATADPVPGNNSASASVTVLPNGADLSLNKDKFPFFVAVGGALSSRITVTNSGPQTATGPLRVVEVLFNETFVSATGTGWSCALATATTLVCNHPNTGGLAVGASLPLLTINTRATVAGSAINTACTGGSVPSGAGGATASAPAQGDPNNTNDCSTATSQVTATSAAADLAVLSVVATTPTGGDKRVSATENSVTFTMKVSNLGPAAATGARVEFYHTNHIVGQTQVSEPIVRVGDINGNNNGSSAEFTCARDGHFTLCQQTGGELRPGDVVTLQSTVSRAMLTQPAGETVEFLVTASNTVESDTNPANNNGVENFGVDALIDLEVTGKTSTPSTVLAGENATYVISYRNRGTDAANGVTVTDTFSFFQADGTSANPSDPGMVVVSVNPQRAGATCELLLANGSATALVNSTITPANNRVRCTIGTMAPGEELTTTLVVRPNSQQSNPTRVARNTAVAASTSTESDLTNNSKSNALTILSNAIDLLINKTDLVDPVPYAAGGATFINYRIRVTSNGPSFGTNVRVAETMTPPPGKRIRFVCDTAGFGSSTCNAVSLCSATSVTSGVGTALPTFTCAVPAGSATTGPNLGELATGQTKDIFLRYQVLDAPTATGDVFTTQSVVTSAETESLLSNNSQTETTTTRNVIDIRVTKATSQPSVAIGASFNWLITVTNNGPGDSLQTDLTDTLPPGSVVNGPVTWTRSLPAGSGTCTLSGLTLSCPLGALSATGVANITVPVSMSAAPVGGVATNRAEVDVNPLKTGALDFPGGNNVATATVTVISDPAAAAINGRVWLDTNNNGVIDGSEAGIVGAVIELTGTETVGGASVNLSITTASDGSWSFANLRPGTYTVRQPSQPPGTLNGLTLAGTGGGTASGPAVAVSSISPIVLVTGQVSANNLFGETPPARVAGRVWLDNNDNGLIDATENGIDGVAVTLSGTDEFNQPVSATALTGADGSYSFPNLRPGTYTVTEQLAQPAGTSNGRTVAGSSGGTATGVLALPSAISAIPLAVGQASLNNNFGETAGAQIAGRVFLDLNNNGAVDGSDTGIAGVTITLTGTDELGNPVTRTTVTAADGSWGFAGLLPGTYSVAQSAQPPGTLSGRTAPGSAGGTATSPAVAASTISNITLARSQQSTANLFAEIPAARLGGRVWGDNNNDGLIGLSEVGLAGVTVVLTGADDLGVAVNRSLTTAADGSYEFGDLRPGNYSVTEPDQPAGTSNGLTVPGSVGGTATAVASTPSIISGITLPVGAVATAYNFGEIPQSPDVVVTKRHVQPVFTAGMSGTYEITVRNAGTRPTAGVYTVQDRMPAGMTLKATPTGAGWVCTGAAGAAAFRCDSSVVLAADTANPAPIVVVVDVAAQIASPANNVVLVEGGGEALARGPSPAERDAFLGNPANLPVCNNPATQNVCRTPTPVQLPASVAGTVWLDGGSAPKLLDTGDSRLAGWLVEVTDPASGAIVGRGTTDANGAYRVNGLEPGVPLVVRFRDPASGVIFGYPVNGETAPGSSGAGCVDGTPPAGSASSCPQTGASPELRVVLAPGSLLPQQSLPIDPSGIVYDAVARTAVPGSVVTLAPDGVCTGWNPSSSVVAATLGGYTINGSSISMTVGPNGFYQYLLAPTAPARCNFTISVTPPSGYGFVSTIIPPAAGVLAPAGGPTTIFAVQPQVGAPTAEVGPGTVYHLQISAGSSTPNIVHNHIPLDPLSFGNLGLSKAGDRAVAEVGDSVRYTLTVRNATGGRPLQTSLVDRLPAGFTYIPGTASVNDRPIADPVGGAGPNLVFQLGAMPANRQLVLRYRVRVGVGAQQGDGINHAQAYACNLAPGCVDAARAPLAVATPTNPAQFRVRVTGGVFTTEACVLGKVFVDCNNNHIQDPEELGIPGVRLMLSDGTTLISDVEGKYSVCGLPPRSHVLKVDPSTVPRGARLTTSSNRNLGDAGSLWLDLKNGELHRADFIEGSCSNTVLEQTKARRAQGEVRSVETEKKGGPALRFDSKAHQLNTLRSPQQGTDGANQQAPKPRATTPVAPSPAKDESNVPTSNLPMNQPPPTGRSSADKPDAAASGASAQGGSNGTR